MSKPNNDYSIAKYVDILKGVKYEGNIKDKIDVGRKRLFKKGEYLLKYKNIYNVLGIERIILYKIEELYLNISGYLNSILRMELFKESVFYKEDMLGKNNIIKFKVNSNILCGDDKVTINSDDFIWIVNKIFGDYHLSNKVDIQFVKGEAYITYTIEDIIDSIEILKYKLSTIELIIKDLNKYSKRFSESISNYTNMLIGIEENLDYEGSDTVIIHNFYTLEKEDLIINKVDYDLYKEAYDRLNSVGILDYDLKNLKKGTSKKPKELDKKLYIILDKYMEYYIVKGNDSLEINELSLINGKNIYASEIDNRLIHMIENIDKDLEKLDNIVGSEDLVLKSKYINNIKELLM